MFLLFALTSRVTTFHINCWDANALSRVCISLDLGFCSPHATICKKKSSLKQIVLLIFQNSAADDGHWIREVAAAEFLPHPLYRRPEAYFDVAVVLLERAVGFSNRILPIW